MKRTRLCFLGLGAVLVATVVAPRGAVAAAPLPTNVIVFDSNRTGGDEIYRMNADGSGTQVRLTDSTASNTEAFWPKPSPDRTKIMFVRTPMGVHDLNFNQAAIWVMDADGGNPTEILPKNSYGWALMGHPEWSPDGNFIALVGGPTANPQIYIVDKLGKNPVQLTHDILGTGLRPGTNIDPSWKPDGQALLFVGCPQAVCIESMYEVYRINRDGTNETRLTINAVPDYDPYYAPNTTAGVPGTGTIAYLQQQAPPSTAWSIQKMNASGGAQGTIINDGEVNSKPAWSLDSSIIYFHRICCGRSKFNIFSIKPDGSQLAELIPPSTSYGNDYPVMGLN